MRFRQPKSVCNGLREERETIKESESKREESVFYDFYHERERESERDEKKVVFL